MKISPYMTTTKQRESYLDSVARIRSLMFDLQCKIKHKAIKKRINLIYDHLELLESQILHMDAIEL